MNHVQEETSEMHCDPIQPEPETVTQLPTLDIEIPERVDGSDAKEIFEAFRKQLAENKPKKGKGKKGGKKKKKK